VWALLAGQTDGVIPVGRTDWWCEPCWWVKLMVQTLLAGQTDGVRPARCQLCMRPCALSMRHLPLLCACAFWLRWQHTPRLLPLCVLRAPCTPLLLLLPLLHLSLVPRHPCRACVHLWSGFAAHTHAPAAAALLRMGDFASAKRILDKVLDKMSASSSHFQVRLI